MSPQTPAKRYVRRITRNRLARWSAQDLARVSARLQSQIANSAQELVRTHEVIDKRRKYRNNPVEWQGEKFRSELERDTWRDLQTQYLAKAIRAVVREVSMPLPGCTRRIRVDFMVVELSGEIRWLDAKGFETAAWRLKRDQVKSAYGISIELVRKA